MATLTPQAFAKRWGESTLSERSSYQQHFLDLCDMLGAPKPAETDPAGEFYTFEKGVEKTGGGKGFADVWYKDHFAIEYKGKHKDLSAAYQQLLQYREALENPPVLMVTDIERFEIHTNFTGTVTRVYAFTNSELPEPENLRLLRAMFTDPYSLRPAHTVESVTEEAAGKFALIADELRDRGVNAQEAAHFLNKILFCLFAEDIALLPENLFSRVVERGVKRPETFNRNVGALFEAMASGGEFSLVDIPHFDGGMFSDGGTLSLEASELSVLMEATRLDWDSVEPAIFGTLFERSLDPNQRARLGAHYTSKEDILTLIEPVLMAPLRREWEQIRSRVREQAEKAQSKTGLTATNALSRAERELVGFAERLRRVSVLDPACGSGNFLYVSLKELLDLEKEVSTFAGEIGLTPFFPGVNPEQLHGIETSPYAHELAQVAIWIGYLQWMIDNGFGSPAEPILGPMTNIVRMDAILASDQDGTAREPEWPEADVIVGNPPFLGSRKMRPTLGDRYCEDLQAVYKGRIDGLPDLVCYWFERARKMIERSEARRVGLLATQAIRGGANRRVLRNIKQSGAIFFAVSDRPWILDGAAVQVSMVGFDDGSEDSRILDGAPVPAINSDLTGSADLSSAETLPENLGISFQGVILRGKFDVSREEAHQMLAQQGNPNGRPNSDVVKPRLIGAEVTGRSRNAYVVDFGVSMPVEDAALYEAPFEYVRKHVYPARQRANQASARERWWLHWNSRPKMRHALSGLNRYIVTPRVAKHRLFVFVKADVIPDAQLVVFAREDYYFLGVLHSRAHELWARGTGTQLREAESGFRYTPTTCFETFPFPTPTEQHRARIEEAASLLDERRKNWLEPEGASATELKKRTLTGLYNVRPEWLKHAHERLDKAVFAAYGWDEGPDKLADDEVLARLLALNVQRAPSVRFA